MEAATRRALRWVAYTVFIVIAPLLLAYAAGYRLRALQQGGLVPSAPSVGALVVRTVPRGAAVALDGTVLASRTPTAAGGIRAGLHAIRIEKAGYRPYEKHLDVRGGAVTDLLAVRLLPTHPEEHPRLAGMTAAWSSPDGRRILLRGHGVFRFVATADLERANPEQELPATAAVSRVLDDIRGDVDAIWAPSGMFVALVVPTTDGTGATTRALLRADGEKIALPSNHVLVGWGLESPDTLVTIAPSNDLVAFTVPRDAHQSLRRTVLASGITAAAIHPQGVLVVRTLAGGSALTIVSVEGPSTPQSAQLVGEIAELAVSRRGHFAARTREGVLSVLRVSEDRWETLAEGVSRADWSPDGNKLLFQESAFDLWAVNISEERSPLPLTHPELLLRLSSPLDAPRWFPDSQRVLFWQHDILTIVEIDPRDGHRVDQLFSSNRGAAAYAVSDGGDVVWVPVRRDGADVLLQVFLRSPADR